MKPRSRQRENLRDLLKQLERSRTLALDEFIQGRLRLIEERFRELGSPDVEAANEDELIIVACRLGYLYSSFESLFRRVAFDFRLVRRTRRPILERMRMDLSPARPAVIDGEAFGKLDALARFRHWFHQAESPLRASDVEPALRKALELRGIYRRQIEAFLEFLRGVG